MKHAWKIYLHRINPTNFNYTPVAKLKVVLKNIWNNLEEITLESFVGSTEGEFSISLLKMRAQLVHKLYGSIFMC